MENDIHLRAILDQIPSMTYWDSLSGDRAVLSISPKSEAILGFSLADCHEDPDTWRRQLHPDDRERVLAKLNAEKRDSPCTVEYRLVSRSGQSIWFRDVSVIRHDHSGHPVHFLGVMFDITEFKRTETSLLLHSRRLRALHDIERGILAVRSPEETAHVVLQRIQQIVPCSRASVTLFDFETKRFKALAAVFKGKSQFRSGGHLPLNTLKKEIDVLEKGKVVHVVDINALSEPSLHIQRLKDEGMRTYVYVPLISQEKLIGSLNLGDNYPGAFGEEHIQIARELAGAMAIAIEQARLFKWNREQSEQLRRLTVRLAEMEDAERKRLARELHDQVGQNLTALNIHLSVIRDLLPSRGEDELGARLDDSLRLLEETTSHVRGVMVELRPFVVDDYGLVPALHWYAQQYSRRTGVTTFVRGEDIAPRLPNSLEMTLFRIAQEALNNVAKHANADNVTIVVEELKDTVRIVITDDGAGFNPASLKNREIQPGMGIMTMRERAMGIGAQFRIESEPGEGTRVRLDVKR
ncbi:MAG: PAS domain-containing protein [Deltaproteobacteria bacterium]|nr:PAS domain-containing protein [Deltaproteobacteria bacterium]